MPNQQIGCPFAACSLGFFWQQNQIQTTGVLFGAPGDRGSFEQQPDRVEEE